MSAAVSDADLAAKLATEAGRILLALRDGDGFDPKDLGKVGDAQANDFLVHALLDARPDDGLLSEERACDGTRLIQSRVWIIDPVDGTREYGEGRSDWAVHVALAINGVATIGAVALPGIDQVLRSDQPIALRALSERPRMVVSRTRPAKEALAVAEALDAELIPMGSAGAKAMAVVRGEADIYLHTGGQYEWDSCAPVAVAAAHGLHVSRVDGSPLIYNQADSYMPDLLICRSEFAEQVLKLVRGISD
jgi:3'(2'), 5'-bisphosphate nucleotidase